MSEVLPDYDLCMLEHLAYMNADEGLKNTVKKDCSYKELQDCKDVEEYLNQFDLTALRTENPNGYTNGDCINRCEYAAIIDYMLSKPAIRSLLVKDTMKNTHDNTCPLAYDLVYPEGSQTSSENEHIVIFKGTTNGFEWGDNVEGISKTDTQSQREAVAFVDKIDSDSITVVGHSKGGNKAMYCAIVSNKVTRCISMDGQGFSDEFIKKYQYKIIKRAKNIKNYSYSSDYVHALLIQIPGSEQLYTGKGYGSNGVDSFGGCHSPNSLFSYYIDENGNLVMKDDFELTEETNTIYIINGLVEYLMHSDCSNKEELIKYLTYIVASFGGENADSFKQKILSGEESIDVDKLTTILAYLVKYCNEKEISPEELYTLLLDIHVIDGTANIGGIDMLSIIRTAFDYIKSNEEDQNYLIAKIFILWKDRFDDKDKSHDRYYDIAWKVLKNIKGKYNDIRYDPSKKAVIYTDKLKKINALTDLREKGAPAMFYNMDGIETALSKIKELDGLCIENNLNNLDSVSGKCAESISTLNDMYNSVFEKLCTLLIQTRNQVQEVYDAVYALENL